MSNNMSEKDTGTVTYADVKKNLDVADNFSDQATLFTKREWIMRYASPFRALMFMAGPMVIIMLVNSLYGIIDKQLALNFAIDNVLSQLEGSNAKIDGFIHVNMIDQSLIHIADGMMLKNADGSWTPEAILFAKQLINVSTQYSNTIITLLSAMSLLTAVGTAIRWGQAMGARDKQKMDSILISGVIQTLIIGVVGLIVLHFVGPYIITAQANVNYSEKESSLIFLLSNQYTQTFIYGFPLLALATFISTLLRTEGKVWWVIGINLTAVVLNVVTGELFMEGAADTEKMQAAVYGSMIAWGFMITSCLLVIAISKNTLLAPVWRHIKLTLQDAAIIWIYGTSPFIANVIFAVSNFIMTYLITIAHNGDQIKDAILVRYWPNGVDEKLANLPIDSSEASGLANYTYISPTLRVMSSSFPWMNILYAPIIGMMEGANANYAYCKGAEKRFRLMQIWRIHLFINIIWGVLCLVLIAAAGGPMMEAFDGPANLKWWFLAYICGIICAGITYSALSLFQGIGDALDATLIAIIRSLICGIGFIVIGWAIAKNLSKDGTGDWVIFLMNGLCEFPAMFATWLLVAKLFRKWIKTYQVNDKTDQFAAPSLLTAAENEITISVHSITTKITKKYKEKIDKVIAKHGSDSEKVKYLEDKRDLKIEQILYKSREKRTKVKDKYRFDTLSFGKDSRDTDFKVLDIKELKTLIEFLNKGSFDLQNDVKEIEKHYALKREKLEIKHEQNAEYYEKIRNGEVKLTPWKLLFMKVEPQPLWDLPERNDDKKTVIIR